MNAVMLIAVAGLAWYLAHCWLRPFASCFKCKGAPVNRSKRGGSYNISCKACDSSGRRRRLGSYLLGGRGYGRL